MIRVGMVGGGFMARTYSFALSAVHGLAWPAVAEVLRVRLADVSSELGRSTADAWGWGEVSQDWRAVTRAADVDLVLVLTPNDTHAEIAIDALAHGKHVLCEKPLSNTVDGARAMYRAAAASGRGHQVGFVYRKWPAAAFAKELIESASSARLFTPEAASFTTMASTLRGQLPGGCERPAQAEAAAPTSAAM
jgi:predicted dehydrogenase